MPLTKFLTHLRRNVVAYLALVVALGTGTAYAAGSIPDGSVTAAKLHKNAVTSNKIKNGTIKPKDIKKPTYVQSTNLSLGTPPAVPDLVSVAPYDFTLPHKARTSVTVFIPTIGGSCDNGNPDQPTIGLYIDNIPIAGTAATVPATRQRPLGAADRHASAHGCRAHRPGRHHLQRCLSTQRRSTRCQDLDHHPGRLRFHRGRETPHAARASGSGCGGSRHGVVHW